MSRLSKFGTLLLGLFLVASWPAGSETIHPGDPHADRAIHDNIASEIVAVTLKAPVTSADHVLIEDSTEADAKKRATIGAIIDLGELTAGTFLNKVLQGEWNTLAIRREAICENQVDGVDGEFCFDNIGETIWVCTPTVGLCDTTAEWTNTHLGGGEANTYSSAGGGLAVIGTKSGVDLPHATFDAADFDLVTDVLSIDDANWASQAELEAQDTCAELSGCVVSAITSTGVTYENLDTNGDIGFGAAQVPQGSATAPLAGPTFTGDPKAPTPALADDDTSIATTAYVKNQEHTVCKTIEDLVIADDNVPLFYFNTASTIIKIGCDSDAATTVNLQSHSGVGVDANLVCGTFGAVSWDSSLSGTTAFGVGAKIQIDTITESTPTWTAVCFVYTSP